jgi:hypothetical protein
MALFSQLQASLGGTGYPNMNPYDPMAQYQMRYQQMQNELVSRDMDRKTSMSFGNGGFGSYLPSMQNNNHSLMD